MAVENTKVILEEIVEMSRLLVESSPRFIQQKLFYHHLKSYFSDVPPEELLFILIRNGLFTPEEIVDIEFTLKQLEEKNT